MEIYTVRSGDSVDLIATRYGIPVEVLTKVNQIEPPYRLAVGQGLLIANHPRMGNRRGLEVNGYAYPFINGDTLNVTLPYLTDLNVFSYGFTDNGDLIPPMGEDVWMTEAASAVGVRPILTLTPMGADGRFNNQLITAVLGNPETEQRLIWELGRTVLEKGYGGVDVDFEYIEAADKIRFASFVKKLTQVMNLFGYLVSVALAPKTSADQRGLLYEGKDYRLLGAAANRAMLMTYEWGYTYGPPMAVAPINMVRRVVDYAVTEIPREKISLGIPNYGYDWALPYKQGVTKARTISNMEAVRMAIDFGVEIQFDLTAMTPYFHYWQYGVQHEVWFEDIRSMKAKFDLIEEYGLGGAGYWQLMQLFLANWVLLADTFHIKKVQQPSNHGLAG